MAQAQLMYVGTSEGLVMLSNPGRTERWLTVGNELAGESITALACEAEAPMRAVAASAGGLHLTSDGGQQWAPHEGEPPPAPAAAYDFPAQPPARLRIAGDPPALERAGDDGEWAAAAFEAAGEPAVIAAPAYHPDTAYVGTAGGEIWQSTDRGRSWIRIKRDLPPVQAIALGRLL
ncbi:MAG TPA: hypothetical protein VGE07_31750 [Herpetosiphonaceae bacterium]